MGRHSHRMSVAAVSNRCERPHQRPGGWPLKHTYVSRLGFRFAQGVDHGLKVLLTHLTQVFR
jgi:hypothetical protein